MKSTVDKNQVCDYLKYLFAYLDINLKHLDRKHCTALMQQSTSINSTFATPAVPAWAEQDLKHTLELGKTINLFKFKNLSTYNIFRAVFPPQNGSHLKL